MSVNKKILIVDPASYVLPYDYWFLKGVKSGSTEVDISFFCSSTAFNSEYIQRIRALGVEVQVYNIAGRNSWSAAVEYLKMLCSIFKRRNEFSIVHFQWSLCVFLELLFFYCLRKKLYFTFHNHKPHNVHRKRYIPFVIISFLAKKSVFVSQFTASIFLNNYLISKDKCIVLPHPLMPFFEREKATSPVCFNPSICFWGNIKPYKGIEFLYEIAQACPKLSFVINGKWDDSLFPLLTKFKSLTNCNVSNKFLSEDELQNFVESHDIFIMPYKNATQSGVFYRLLAHRKIILTTQTGDMNYQWQKYGLERCTFPYGDINEFLCAYNSALKLKDVECSLDELLRRYSLDVQKGIRTYLKVIMVV